MFVVLGYVWFGLNGWNDSSSVTAKISLTTKYASKCAQKNSTCSHKKLLGEREKWTSDSKQCVPIFISVSDKKLKFVVL